MSAMSSVSTQPALFAGQNYAKRMPSSMQAMCMATAASIIIIGTGVSTSVPFFALVLILCVLLLASLVVLVSLSGLTGLLSLVGLTGLDPGITQGD